MFDQKLTDLLNDAAADAEAALDDDTTAPLADHVTVSRPGRARSKVLQVRLTPDEFEALELIASERELPVSTIARDQLLRLISRKATPSGEPAGWWSGAAFDEFMRVTTEFARTSSELNQSLRSLVAEVAQIRETVPIARDVEGS